MLLEARGGPLKGLEPLDMSAFTPVLGKDNGRICLGGEAGALQVSGGRP